MSSKRKWTSEEVASLHNIELSDLELANTLGRDIESVRRIRQTIFGMKQWRKINADRKD